MSMFYIWMFQIFWNFFTIYTNENLFCKDDDTHVFI